jgi:hypothetical protein
MNRALGKSLGPAMLLVFGLSSLVAADPGTDPATSLRWRPIQEEAEALAAGKPVLYFFTAAGAAVQR